jgi:hypothetical protein
LKRSLIILAATALTCVGLSAVATAHTVRFDSTVTIQKHRNGADPDSLTGRVNSDRPRCEPNRTIEIYQEVTGDDTLLATTITDAEGRWEFVFPAAAPEGTYYAKVTRKVLRRNERHRHVCRPDVSNTVKFN